MAENTKQISLRIDSTIYNKLWQISHERETVENKVTITDIVKEALEYYLAEKHGA